MPQFTSAKVLLALAAFTLFPIDKAFADTINLGFFTFDAGPNNTAAFNITNDTGVNASTFPDTTFPVVTPVSFTDLTLIVNFADGSAEQFDPSSGYFSLNSDLLSLSGQLEADFATNPISSAFLIGTFGTTDLLLNDGTIVSIDPTLTALMIGGGPAGALAPGDFALIQASTVPVGAVPEPTMAILLVSGLGGIVLKRALL